MGVDQTGKEKDAAKGLGHNIEQFTVVSCLEDFLKRGHGNRTVRLLKIHGCLGDYRERASYEERRAYLKSIVFNYREIQHWRRDAWARDLVRGFQRTHSVVFLGYSMADPVVHATMREVYEEMENWRAPDSKPTEDPPAFYFSYGEARDFYAVEILEAADQAVGIKREKPEEHREEHPHFLDFHGMWPKGAPGLKFPNQDEALKWVNHLAFRKLQEQALDQALEQALMDTLGEPRPKSRIESIKEQLEAITKAEREAIYELEFQGDERFKEITDWTWTFHPAVMRAMVCTEREQIDAVPVDLRAWEGESGMLMKAYCPSNDHLPWLAWSTVVELALRRAAAVRMRQQLPKTHGVREGNLRFRIEPYPRGAQVSFARDEGPSERGVHLDWETKSAPRGKPIRTRRGSRLNVKQWMIARRPWRLDPDEGRKQVFRADRWKDSGAGGGADLELERRGNWRGGCEAMALGEDAKDWEQLRQALGSDWEVIEESELPETGNRFIWPGSKWTIAEQVEIEAEALVIDGELGSLGIVQQLPGSEKEIEDLVDDMLRIAQALESRVVRNDGLETETLCVDLVVRDNGKKKTDPALISALRNLVEETLTMSGISLNIWRPENGKWMDPAAIRRAFPWVLSHTRTWYQTRGKPVGGERLERILLENFRLPGKQELALAPGLDLHVVHGFNGSGKTSLSEALEYGVTGKVARLEEEKDEVDYRKVLANKDAARNARKRVGLQLRNSGEVSGKIEKNGAEPLFEEELAANAFRFDQGLSDSLSKGSPEERARIFLEAFFPEEREKLLLQRDARKNVEAELIHVGDEDWPSLSPDDFEKRLKKAKVKLKWVTAGEVKLADLAQQLPVSLDVLKRLRKEQLPSWKSPVSASALEPALKELDDAVREISGIVSDQRDLLGKVVPVMERLQKWVVKGKEPASHEDYPALINRFLEAETMTNLYEDWARITRVLEGAHEADWTPHPDLEEAAEYIKKARRGVKAARVENIRDSVRALRDKLQERATAIDPNAAAELGKTERVPFSEADVRAMNRAGDLLRPDIDFGAGFGELIQEAMVKQETRQVDGDGERKPIVIGKSGWVNDLLRDARQLRENLAGVDAEKLKSWQPIAGRLSHFQLLLERIEIYESSRSDTAREFLKHIADKGELAQALNEIMALCMPSSFAYKDIMPQFDRVGESFDITTEDIRAALHFNTAELNLLALSMFLLCAPLRRENPIRTIVLDDPLQNMDEMTVCTLARGLRRLLRLWKNQDALKDWQLLVLLHSETQAERLESEIVCGSYRMPWLSGMATASKDVRKIEEESKFEGKVEVQKLPGLVVRTAV